MFLPPDHIAKNLFKNLEIPGCSKSNQVVLKSA